MAEKVISKYVPLTARFAVFDHVSLSESPGAAGQSSFRRPLAPATLSPDLREAASCYGWSASSCTAI